MVAGWMTASVGQLGCQEKAVEPTLGKGVVVLSIGSRMTISRQELVSELVGPELAIFKLAGDMGLAGLREG